MAQPRCLRYRSSRKGAPNVRNPVRPGPVHLGYTLTVFEATALSGSPSALMGYTASQPWPPDVVPPLGVFIFDREVVAGFGQSRAFVMDLRRIAFVPVTPAWFARRGQPGHCIHGHVPKRYQRRFRETATDLLARHGEIVDRFGPLWPGVRR